MKTRSWGGKTGRFNLNRPPGVRGVLICCVLIMLYSWCPHAAAEPRCTGVTMRLAENNIWAMHQCSAEFKDSLSSYFRLKKSDWDEGWGWSRCTQDLPFGKMLNSTLLLLYGLESWENYPRDSNWYLFGLGSWAAENATTDSESAGADFAISPNPGFYDPVVLNRSNDDLQIVGINQKGYVMYYRGGQRPGDWVARNITYDHIDAGHQADYRLISHPVHVSDGGYDYFFGVTAARDVVLYQRSVLGGPWWGMKLTKNNPARSQYRAFRRLAAVYSGAKAYAFGINAQGRLIRYSPDPEVIDITGQVVNGDSMYRVDSHLLASSHAYRMHVYGLSSTRWLIHYYQTQTGAWAAEVISSGGAKRLFNQSSPVLIRNADGSDQILGVSDDGELLLHIRSASGAWSVMNMTSNVYPSGGENYKLDPRNALTAYRDANNLLRVFGVNANSEVVQYSLDAGTCTAENITRDSPNIGSRFRASLGPGAVGGANDSQHVYVRGFYGQLYHYYRSPTHPWSADDITTRTNIGIAYNFVTTPIIAPRPDNSHHVIALNLAEQVIHYYTSSQAHPWHSNADYAWLAAGDVHDFHYKPEDDWSDVAAAQGGFWQSDMVKMRCPSFDGSASEGGAEGRAAAMLHEATHVIYWRWEHGTHPVYGGYADRWLYHGVNDYPPDSLNRDRKHSMYQIQVEYLSDLAEFPAKWVPLEASLFARGLADSYWYSIINPPAWKPGEPRPF